MHGLIAADSLNIPNLRLTVSDKLTGGNFKFHDYYSIFDIKNHVNINLFDNTFKVKETSHLLNLIDEKFILKESKIEQVNKDLLKAFKTKSKYA